MSNFKSNPMNSFFKRPVGAAVLFLNDFHHGKNLAVLNRASRLVPEDVKGFASLLSDTPNANPDYVQGIINMLDNYANDAVDGRLKDPKGMTQDKCERAVKALNESGFSASHVMGSPDDHGVWLDNVWNADLQEAYSFRIHNEEIIFWA